MMPVVDDAIRAAHQGLSPIPIARGTKKAKASWKAAQEAISSDETLRTLFVEGDAMAVICGRVSGGLEIIDFDEPRLFKSWARLLDENGQDELRKSTAIQKTPSGGYHVLYRCPEELAGNQKLASTASEHGGIETRGEGGYFLCFPSEGYQFVSGDLSKIPTINADQRDVLLSAARMLNEVYEEPGIKERPERHVAGCRRPGDAYNLKAQWSDILTGWAQKGRTTGNRMCWVRPGKDGRAGISATTTGDDLVFYCHTSNAPPFEPTKSYSKFAAYALLNHGGDFHLAAQELSRQGYGGPPVSRIAPTNGQSKTLAEIKREDGRRGLGRLETFTADFTPPIIEFLIEPYLPKGKCVLLDADGGCGKSSLAVAIAAGLSRGVTPVSFEPCDPVRTLYLHKREDSSEELEAVYRANGGVPGMISYYSGDALLDEDGASMIEEAIEDGKFGLVVFDALFYFLPSMEDTYNALPVMAVMERLNRLAAATAVCILNIRHTSKGRVGKSASDLGMGSVQFRNSHRGQLVARWHPDQEMYRGVVLVTDEKGSLLVMRGSPFAFKRHGLELQYLRDVVNPFDGEVTRKYKNKVDECKEMIRALCRDQWVSVPAVCDKALSLSISSRTLDRARAELTKCGELLAPSRLGRPDGQWHLRIDSTMEAYDPYSDE